jgi:hypothetical protein
MVYDPEVSPIYGDFRDFPETIFFADDTEVFVSDALIAADKLHRLGIRVEAFITHGLTHCYGIEMPDLPESQVFYGRIRKFFGLSKGCPAARDGQGVSRRERILAVMREVWRQLSGAARMVKGCRPAR